MFGDRKNSDAFLEKGKNLSKTVRSVHFFISSPIMAKVERAPPKNEHNWTKIDDLVSKTMFGDRKNSDAFLEKGKNLSKTVRSVHFFISSPIMAKVERAPPKMSTIGLKLTIWCPKQCSVIEKVKPHRARILFLERGKNLSKMVRSVQFFYFIPN